MNEDSRNDILRKLYLFSIKNGKPKRIEVPQAVSRRRSHLNSILEKGFVLDGSITMVN